MHSRRRAHLGLALGSALAATCGLVLRRFPPQAYGFYPVCPFHQLTGLLCPGCGATRALAALGSGQLTEALHLNALAVVAFTCAAAVALTAYVRALHGSQSPWPRPRPLAIGAALTTAILFTIARNLHLNLH